MIYFDLAIFLDDSPRINIIIQKKIIEELRSLMRYGYGKVKKNCTLYMKSANDTE